MTDLKGFSKKQTILFGIVLLMGIAALIVGLSIRSEPMMLKTLLIFSSIFIFVVFGILFSLAAITNVGGFDFPTGKNLTMLRIRVTIATVILVAATVILPFFLNSTARVVLLIFGIPISLLFIGALIAAYDTKNEGLYIHIVISVFYQDISPLSQAMLPNITIIILSTAFGSKKHSNRSL